MSKRVLEPHEMLLYTAAPRPARRAPLRKDGGGDKPGASAESSEEASNHREAIREYRQRCGGADPWVCAEALIYLSEGNRIIERYALWLFPSDSERCLVASNDKGVDEFYVLVRLEGKARLDKLSLGVCKSPGTARATEFAPSHATQGAPVEVDPTEGHVVRIVSIEHDGEPLQHPEDASPYLPNAKHIREVIRKHAGKCESVSTMAMLHTKFGVLRTQSYLAAKATMDSDDCGPEEWKRALCQLEDPASFPWALANRVAELGALDKLKVAETGLLPGGKVHIADDIWLVDEALPLESSEFLVAARWAVQKSIKGTGSIPRAKLWEPVVMLNHRDELEFRLMRMA